MLDTDVVVSALLSVFGPPARILDLDLAVASQGSATLVTGNGSHYPKAIRGAVKVLTPVEFLDTWQRRMK